MTSTFRTDGYLDRMRGNTFSPPDVAVLAMEYRHGWDIAEKEQQPEWMDNSTSPTHKVIFGDRY